MPMEQSGLRMSAFGLDVLLNVERVVVQQKVELAEVLTGFETANRYELKSASGRSLLFAAEKGGFLMRNCLRRARPFTMSLLTAEGREVAKFSRPCRCQLCPWSNCCLQELDVESPVGHVTGSLRQMTSCWPFAGLSFEVCDARGTVQLLIKGPACVCGKVNFKITALDGQTELGGITKEWGGLAKELLTAADTFSVSFPPELSTEMKTVLIGACFLLDFLFFERA